VQFRILVSLLIIGFLGMSLNSHCIPEVQGETSLSNSVSTAPVSSLNALMPPVDCTDHSTNQDSRSLSHCHHVHCCLVLITPDIAFISNFNSKIEYKFVFPSGPIKGLFRPPIS
jgi:hypothetical protein